MFSKTAISVSLLAAASQVSAQVGASIIKNQCAGPVYMDFVSQFPSPTVTIAPGQSVTNPFATNPDGGGISIKLSTVPGGPITQFEYTLGTGDYADLFYDISNINGYPFMDQGLSLFPSDPSCRSVVCPPGVVCTLAYNQPDDNEATASCGIASTMTLVLCSANSGSDSGSAAPPPSSSSSVVVTTPTPIQQLAPTSSTEAPTTSAAPATTVSSSSTPPPPPSSTSTSSTSSSTPPPPPPSTTSTSSSVTPIVVPTSTVESLGNGVVTTVVGYVTTTFVTEIKTVYATPVIKAEATGVSKREGEDGNALVHKGHPRHRHHHHHHTGN